MKGRFYTPRESMIPKGAVKVADKRSDAVAYLFARQDKPCAMIFWGKQSKPVEYCRYRDETHRARRIAELFERWRQHNESKVAEQAKRKAFAHACQVGDVYRTSWGYDQTNVEFFEVVEVKGKYAVLREIESASTDDGRGSERCVAQSGAFLKPRYEGDDRGLPIRRLIQDGRIKIDDVRTGWPWGKRIAGVLIGEAAHRTAFGYGH